MRFADEGDLDEAATPVGDGTVSGSLLLDIGFEPLAPLRKLSMSPPAQFGGVALAALVAAAIAGLVRLASPRSSDGRAWRRCSRIPRSTP